MLFGSLLSTFAVLCPQQRCSRTLLQTSPTAFQKPSAPSAMTSLGAKSRPRRFRSSSSSFHDKALSRTPSVNPTSSFLPSNVAPMSDAAFDHFVELYETKYDKAVGCLKKDRDVLLAFYDFPAEHWKHLRTTNPIESTFATVRHRTIRSKGCLSNKTALVMVFKLLEGAQKSWRRLDGHTQLPKLVLGVTFNDGIEVIAKPTDRQPATAAA